MQGQDNTFVSQRVVFKVRGGLWLKVVYTSNMEIQEAPFRGINCIAGIADIRAYHAYLYTGCNRQSPCPQGINNP